MDRAAAGVQYVFAFMLLAGIVVLLAAVQATRDERMYESAMLRTLGATRRVVLGSVAAEFTALGLLAGILAAVTASLAGYVLAEGVFELDYTFDPTLWLVGLIAGALLVGTTGTLATLPAVTRAPLQRLREHR